MNNKELIETSKEIEKYDDGLAWYCREIAKYPRLSAEEEKELIHKYKHNNDTSAKDKLIMSTTRLVISVAKKYQYYNFSLIDAIQDGNIGLITALEKFDDTLDVRFSTYALFWIKHFILKGNANADIIKLPSQVKNYNKEIVTLKQETESALGYSVSASELADITGIPLSDIEQSLSLSQIAPLDNNETMLMLENIPDTNNTIDNISNQQVLKDTLSDILSDFSEIEQKIIIEKYGLNESEELSDEELSKKHNISVSQVKKIEKKVLRKMQSPKIKIQLKEFV